MRYKWTSGVSLDTCSRDFLWQHHNVRSDSAERMKTMYILGSENAGIESESLKGLLQTHKVGLETKLRIHDSCQEFLLFHKNTKPKYGACIYYGESDQEGLRSSYKYRRKSEPFSLYYKCKYYCGRKCCVRERSCTRSQVRPWNATPSKSPRFCREKGSRVS